MLTRWAPVIEALDLVPSSKGRFEVTIDGDVIFSKAELGRHAEPGEVIALVEERVGPPIAR